MLCGMMLERRHYGDASPHLAHGCGPLATIGGAAAVTAGLCWIGKGGVILVAGVQPPLLFEVAPVLMALSVLALGRHLPPARPRTACTFVAAAAAAAALPVLADEAVPLPAAVTGTAMAAANLLVLGGLAIAGTHVRRLVRGLAGTLPLALALATVPALLLGGLAAAVVGERALELPIVALGAAWAMMGALLMRRRYWTGL